jgi:ribosome biogenesis GTPase
MRHLAASGGMLPAAGDWVAVRARADEGRATIVRVLERRTKLSRKAAGAENVEQILAANVDTVFVVCGLDGDFNLRRIERYLAVIWESGARPVVLLNKADLCNASETRAGEARRAAPDVDLWVISALQGEGLEALDRYLEGGQTVALVGSSGAGKSTLLNRLIGAEIQRTVETRRGDDRGRHATTARRLFVLPTGGLLIDTPGLRELAFWEGETGVERAFEDVEQIAAQCRFRNCRHTVEPLCAVRRALEEGTLDPARFASWEKLRKELAYAERRQDVRLQLEEKRKWKQIHKAHRDPRFPW